MKRISNPHVLSAHEDTFARRLLSNIQASGRQTHPTDPRQAMMLEHFNSHASGAATFSHKTLGTKLRRFNK